MVRGRRWSRRCQPLTTSTPLLPIGIDDFRKLRDRGCWYADKSGLITELVNQPTEAVLLPRPHRFGKSLAMDMTPDYLDTDSDSDGHPDLDEAGDMDLATPPVDTEYLALILPTVP